MRKKKTKRKLKLGNIFIAISLCILFVLVGIYFTKETSNNNLETKSKKTEKIKTEEKEKIYKASLITAGDNLIHSSLYKDANKNANYNGYDFKPMYELIKPIVSNYDIAYYNQETILG